MVGGQKDGQLSTQTMDIVRIAGLLYASLYVFYGILVALGFTESHRAFSIEAIAFLGAAWLMAAWWQHVQPEDTPILNIGQISLFVLLSGISNYFVTGFDSAFVVLWALLITLAALLFGWRGFLSVSGSLVLAGYLDIYNLVDPDRLFESIMAIVTTVFIAYVVTMTLRQAVSDQRELDSSHAQVALQRDRTATLINNLADAVIGTDHNGDIVFHNAATLNLLDTNISIDGKNIDEILHLSDTDGESVSLTDTLQSTKTVTVRDDLLTIATGESTRLEATYAPVKHDYSEETDEGIGYIIILRDVTTAKSLEEERDEFISVVSHELRTPVAIAEGTVSNAQLILDRKDIPSEKATAAVQTAHKQILFLSKMVNDLSTLSRAERGVADEPESIDINDLINDLYNEYEPEAKNKGLQLNLEMPDKMGSVYASRLYLKELMQNFITNAIKYTNEGSVTIKISKAPKKRVTFAVIDTGVGISKASQRKIFDKFYRAEDYRTRETSGTGLGLYVSTKLARKLQTSIECQSRLNHGSTFSITLPLETKKAKRLDD